MYGTIIREARKAKGKTLAEVAVAVGTQPSYLSEVENGVRTNITMDTLERIAAALGLKVTISLDAPTLNDDSVPAKI